MDLRHKLRNFIYTSVADTLIAQLCAIKRKENKKTLKFDRRKSKVTAVSLLLMFAMAVSFVTLPTATAQGTKKTYAFIGALPNPVGVGQEVLLHVGITDPLASVELGWEGLTVTVTKPDGTTETLGPFKTDATGGTGDVYIPDDPGNYTLQTHFPEQVMEVGTMFIPAGTTMLASDSEKLTLVVTEEPVTYYPGNPLPTEYWTRPIDAQLREWNVIAGNWLESGCMINTFPHNYPYRYAPYNDAPESAHILWAKPLTMGGLVSGDLGVHSMNVGDAYQGEFGSSVIINGILYYNRYWVGFAGFSPQQGIFAVDLRTGEELWFRNNTRILFGQTFYWDSYNCHGTFAYIWGSDPNSAFMPRTNWDAYDAFTGEWVYSMENVPIGKRAYGPKGEIFIYTVNNAQGWMTLWNSSRVVSPHGSWEPEGITYSNAAELGLEWNVTIPAGLPGVVAVALDDRIIGSNVPGWTGLANDPITFWGLSTEPGREGTLLFKEVWQPPAGNLTMLFVNTSLDEDVFVVAAKELRALYGFSTATGKKIWGPSVTQPYLDFYSQGEERAISRAIVVAEGRVFSTGMGGVVHCLDAETGELLWKYTAEDVYSEILWSNNWPMRIAFISDGKVYLCHDEHSPVNPLPRGALFICLNATTGEEIWKIDGAFRQTEWGGTAIIGDGIIATYNSYDQRIYAIGKGPSATAVAAAPKVSVHGSSVLVEGTVTDISEGTKDSGIAARFPDGVPAVSDESMSEWMKYVYMQFARPANATGVEVVIEVLDPNNNFYEVGRTTSDSDGMFHCAFTPEVPGEYTVIATFEGSAGYWPSHAKTAINVEEAPAATPAPTPTPAPMTDTYIVGFGTAMIIAIIIGFALLLLRKR
jgi:outer membrane protein assembly factor BamB